MSLLEDTIAAITPPDTGAKAEARAHQDRLTKPRGSLGVLEDLSVQLAGIAGESPPPMPEPAAVAVFAADHGVHAQGVTPWPQEVTGQMVANFLAGGAVVNAVAAQLGATVVVVDIGVAGDVDAVPGLLDRKVRRGTADMTQQPAMTRAEAVRALETGIEVIVRHHPDPADPVGVLAAVGGLEHAGLAGFMLGAAALRVPVLLDGVIAGAAALVAAALAADVVGYLVAGHLSTEPGARAALGRLGLRPLVDLDLRLGEGSGALLALPLVQTAARVLRDVATFDGAGVTDKDEMPG
jgi:nicotinate-nucleotide--dimethylbenzimidazole phosphoribosyltransferase